MGEIYPIVKAAAAALNTARTNKLYFVKPLLTRRFITSITVGRTFLCRAGNYVLGFLCEQPRTNLLHIYTLTVNYELFVSKFVAKFFVHALTPTLKYSAVRLAVMNIISSHLDCLSREKDAH